MEKRKKIEAISDEIILPEAIIQQIQSFLNGKEAAQTTVLSKSWHSAWSTRPSLDFDQRNFRIRTDRLWDDGFSEFTKNTIQRYEELNLNIESLRLCIKWWVTDGLVLANELIVKAMKMGAIDLYVQLLDASPIFSLPQEVLGSKALVRLSVNGCKIDLGENGKVSWSSLKSLSLHRAYIEGEVIWDIILGCPLIEELILSECTCYVKVQSSNLGYNFVSRRIRMLSLSPSTELGKKNVVDVGANLYVFHKLKCLLLEKVKIDTVFFCNFSSKFPCLKDLTLCHCFGYKDIQISCPSLERISFVQKRMLRANFEVPRIRKFTFSASSLPSLSFRTTSREWESDISITLSGSRIHLNSTWFLKLKTFLIDLSPSKISLALSVDTISEDSCVYTGGTQGLPKPPIVENLMLSIDTTPSSVSSPLLHGLFWCIQPKFITQCWLPKSCTGGEVNNDFLELLCKTLVQDASENCCIPNKIMSDLHGLEEVNAEFSEENPIEWQPLSLKTLLDALEIPESKRKVRFKLTWRQKPITSR